MRQYTIKEQIQHLIELGFPTPINTIEVDGYPLTILDNYASTTDEFGWIKCYYGYTIGELIEFLGIHLMGIEAYVICNLPIKHRVQYKREPNKVGYKEIQGELIDKLYDACVELKKEGVI